MSQAARTLARKLWEKPGAKKHMRQAMRKYWEKMSPAERSAEMSRRRKLGIENKRRERE